jgi:D-sedoheptulose 7-phosphate isomerase
MLDKRIHQHFIDSATLKYNAADQLVPQVVAAVGLVTQALSNGNKLLICGNGGSASDAMHFAAEMVGRLERERPELAALALTADTALLTAVGNDYGYEHVFSKQVRGLGQAGDVLVAISTSGNSGNVLAAIEAARERDMPVLALTGRGGGRMREVLRDTDVHICVPHERTMRIQEVHLLCIHAICDGVDEQLLGDSAESTP